MMVYSQITSSAFRLIKLQVQRSLRYHLNLANQHFQTDFTMPEVQYSVRGKKAGVAYLQTYVIKLNPILLMENTEAFLQQVVPHELAHLIVFQLCGQVKPHGKEWKAVMENVFHLPAEIYHQFDLTSVYLPHARLKLVQFNKK